MTADEQVFETLTSITRLPGTMWSWAGDPPSWPYFVYRRVPGAGFFADNGDYHEMPRYLAELHTNEHDPRVVARFASAVRQLGTYAEETPRVEGGELIYAFRFTLTTRAVTL